MPCWYWITIFQGDSYLNDADWEFLTNTVNDNSWFGRGESLGAAGYNWMSEGSQTCHCWKVESAKGSKVVLVKSSNCTTRPNTGLIFLATKQIRNNLQKSFQTILEKLSETSCDSDSLANLAYCLLNFCVTKKRKKMVDLTFLLFPALFYLTSFLPVSFPKVKKSCYLSLDF